MICDMCGGSGACDPCDGYGTTPDSYPNAGDGTDCDLCDTTGICPDCGGTGATDTGNDDPTNEDNELSGVMT